MMTKKRPERSKKKRMLDWEEASREGRKRRGFKAEENLGKDYPEKSWPRQTLEQNKLNKRIGRKSKDNRREEGRQQEKVTEMAIKTQINVIRVLELAFHGIGALQEMGGPLNRKENPLTGVYPHYLKPKFRGSK